MSRHGRLRWQAQPTRRMSVARSIVVSAILLLLPLVTAAQLKVPDAAQIVGAPQGTPVAGVQLDRRTTEVAGLLRCPVCQGLSVADSPSAMAVNMKGQVRELLARGYTQEQIVRYFEHSYGEFVELKPKFQGVNTLVWTLPVFVLIAGAALVFLKLRKLESPAPTPDTQDPTPNEDPYVTRVRDLVKK